MATRSKLAVIFHADVVGSTGLVQQDEGIAHERMRDSFKRLSHTVSAYGGITHEVRGDALVAQFDRASDAVSAALLFQAENTQANASITDDIRPEVRVGIALGEVVIADQTVTGAGVVMAQRLEQLSHAGGVVIQGAVHEAVPHRLPFAYEFLGEQEVKGFDEAIRAFSVALREGASVPDPQPLATNPGGVFATRRVLRFVVLAAAIVGAVLLAWFAPWQPEVEPADPRRMAFKLPDQPSVAVLPFENMSSEKEQEYFADGITEDIITDLSKVAGLFVVARNSTFTYKGAPVEIRQVAEDLGVRYVLEGSVRRSGDRIRVTAQLIDALEGNHLWAERYDRELEDVFVIQSDVAGRVTKALALTLKAGEIERLFLRQTTSIEAYDAFLKARRLADAVGKDDVERADALYQRAIELDSSFASAYAGLSFNNSVKARFRLSNSPDADAQRALQYALKAIELDPRNAWGHIALGGAHLANRDPDAAVKAVREALAIQPNGYEANLFMGLYLQYAGQSEKAVEHLELAQRLNPVDTVRKLAFLGFAYFMNGDYQKAESIWRKRLDKFPVKNELGLVFLAATYAMLGRTEDAAKIAKWALEVNPEFRLNGWRWIRSYKVAEDRQRLYDAAKLAGLPE